MPRGRFVCRKFIGAGGGGEQELWGAGEELNWDAVTIRQLVPWGAPVLSAMPCFKARR